MVVNTHAESWIRLVLDRADELRAAGVTHVQCGDCTADLSKPQAVYEDAAPTPEEIEAESEQWVNPDPMRDDATYLGGRKPDRGRRYRK